MKNKITYLISILALLFLTANPVSALQVEKMGVICPVSAIDMLEDGDVYGQSFVSETDTFGYVSVRFSNYNTDSDDQIIFRIKEEGTDNWLVEHTFKLDKLANDEFFDFAFHPITDSQGKNYVFEIEMVSGPDEVPLGVFLAPEDCRETGYAYANGEELDADIIFKLAAGESGIERFVQDVQHRITSDLYFFIFWGILLIVVFAALFKDEKNK